MRATGRDIAELFGFAPDDTSAEAVGALMESECPFTGARCSKTDHSGRIVYGVCSVSRGASSPIGDDVIICPNRMYAGGYDLLADVSRETWGDLPLVVGGSFANLRNKALAHKLSVVAFGQRSGTEISAGNMSMDWVLQKYSRNGRELTPIDSVGIEVQSVDITGNYRAAWKAYCDVRLREPVSNIPNSLHGFNWANVHKRLIPQLLRKGNIYSRLSQVTGFYFLAPDPVFEHFLLVLRDLEETPIRGRDVLSVRTVRLGPPVPRGQIRSLIWSRTFNYLLSEVATMFVSNVDLTAVSSFERRLRALLR